MRSHLLVLTASLVLLSRGLTIAQPAAPDLKIDRVSQDDGLPTLPVSHAFEDEQGFLWFSSWNGLYRFDGYSYAPYQHDAQDPASVSSDWVTSTLIDHQGRFWVATHGGGLNVMDRVEGRFRHLRHQADDPSSLTSNEIASISLSRDGSIWAATSDGLNRVDPETNHVESFQPDRSDPSSLVGGRVRTVFQDRDGAVWVGTGNPFVAEGEGALNLLDAEQRTFESYLIRPNDPTSLNNFIQSIVQANDSTLYVAPWTGGIFTFDLRTRRFLHFADPIPLDVDSPEPKIVNLMLDENGSILWVSTYGAGLQRLDISRKRWATYLFDADDPFTVPDNRIWGTWYDSAGWLWIGTHSGLARTSVGGRLPRIQVPEIDDDEWVTDVLEGTRGELWLATNRNALVRWHLDSGRSRRYALPATPCAGWKFPGVGLERAAAGHLWVVGPCGLFAFHPDRGLFEALALHLPDNNIGSDQAIRVLEDSKGRLWIPAQPALVQVDPKTATTELYQSIPDDSTSLSSPDLESVLEDATGQIWVGTADGLNLLDAAAGRWTQYPTGQSGYSTAVTSILDSGDGGLWITTDRDGLEYFRPGSARGSTFGIKEGLHSNTLMLSTRDTEGFMWTISPTGLSVIDPQTLSVRRFYTLDGLVDVRFGRHDMTVLSNGNLIIGGRGGVNLFDPRDYHPASDPPHVVLDALRVRGLLVNPSAGSDPGSSDLLLSLTSEQNDLVFDYVGLGVAQPGQIRYAYQLIGVDESWVEVGEQRSARYSGLSPGEYVFNVRAATGAGPWSDVRSVAISIDPPWWQTRWAYLLYFACLAGALILVVRTQARRMVAAEQQRARQHELEQARVLKRAYDELERTHDELKETQARLDEMKSRFFANISHEFRTPLTLIIGQTEALLANAGDGDRSKLEMLGRNGRHLLRLINQLLDLSAMEAGGMELRPEPIELISFFKNIVGSFESLAHQKGVDLRFTSDHSELPGRFERDKLEKIFVNLVSNALKFTDAGSVTVTLRRETAGENDMVVATVSDTGIGISPERLPRIFDRFYQVGSTSRRPHEGTGIGLALVKELINLHGGIVQVDSEVGKGSTFTVKLPLSMDAADEAPREEVVTSASVDSDASTSAASDSTTALLDDGELREQESILVVEDNGDVRTYILDNLAPKYARIAAHDGEMGLALALEHAPDAIITDVMMPKMDGFELARRLRSDQRTSHIPIIMLTARAGEDDKIEGLGAGIDDYLIKPFSPRELRARVDNLLEQRRRLRKRFATSTRITPTDVSAVSMDQEFVKRVLCAVEANLGNEAFSAETLATEIGMSQSQINRKLKALIDQSAGRLIRSMRLQRAADLLLQQAGGVAEIAYEVGFGSHATFSTAFKRQFGVTPSEYSKDTSND